MKLASYSCLLNLSFERGHCLLSTPQHSHVLFGRVEKTMCKRLFFALIAIVAWLFVVGFSPVAIAVESMKPKQSVTREKQIAQLEQDLQLLRQRYEAQQMAINDVSNMLRAQEASLQALRDEGKKQTQLLTTLGNNDPKVTDLFMVGISVALLWLSFLAWRINKQIAWFTGAMESHSQIMLMLEASKKEAVTLRWWDPYFNGPKKEWPTKGQHNEAIELKEIYVGLPVERRKRHPCRARLRTWWEGKREWLRNIRSCLGSLLLKTQSDKSTANKKTDTC